MSELFNFTRENIYLILFAVLPLILILIAAIFTVVYLIWRGIMRMSACGSNSGGVDAAQADMLMDDAEAISYIGRYGKRRSGRTCTVSVGEIGRCFSDGDIVTINSLHDAGLVGAEYGRVKILAGGRLDKALSIHADGFSLAAVKMIIINGGSVNKIG